MTHKSLSKKFIETCIFRSWWVILFLLFCYGFYVKGMGKKKEAYLELNQRLHQFEEDLFTSLQVREDLLLQKESQNDPHWIEMTLKRKLGLVPEGQIKIYFESQEQ